MPDHSRAHWRGAIFLLCLFVLPGRIAQAQADHASVSAPTQETDACGGQHKMGDRLTCYVTFAAAADLTHIEVVFNIEDSIGGNLVLRESRRVGPKTYEVSGPIADCRPGTYALADVIAANGQASRLYQGGFGLSSNITLEVEKALIKTEPRIPRRRIKQSIVTGISQAPQAFAAQPQTFPEVQNIEGASSSTNPFASFARSLERFTGRNRCTGTHRPGDRLSCRLKFERAIELSSLSILLDMDERDRVVPYYQRPEDQRGLCTSFVFEHYRRIDARTYEVSGTLPVCGSGKYFLSEITAFTACDNDVHCRSRSYSSPTDIRNPATFRLKNPHQALFPALSGVSSKSGL